MDRMAFRRAIEAHDVDGMAASLAPGVVLHSPVAFKPFVGHDAVMALLRIIVTTFEDFHYTDELDNGSAVALVFRARIGTRAVEGLDLLRFDGSGLIDDFTVMVRPLSAATALAEAVGPHLAALGVAGH